MIYQKDLGKKSVVGQWIKGKSIAGPTGPYLVTKDEIKDINNINFTLDLKWKKKTNWKYKKYDF